MKISELFNIDRPLFSCEIFPPKEAEDYYKVESVAKDIAKHHPDFISVTFGAGGGTSQNSLKISSMIQDKLNIPSISHLTCGSMTKLEVEQTVLDLKSKGVQNILAMRGDLPINGGFPEGDQYRYASELITAIHQLGDFCIGGACYPEGHVESPSQKIDLIHLKEKVDCGCNFLVTQMFFDNNIFYRFLNRALGAKIHIPIIPGVMPVVNKNQIKRICQLSGTQLPHRFLQILDHFGDNEEAMKEAGIVYATEQIVDLLANGVQGIHLYTMNKPYIAQEIMGRISAILKK